MKVSCTRDNLQQGLSIVSHVTTKNINLPILQNVLLKTEGGLLKLSTTNLEVATNCVVRGKIEKEGDFTVPSKLFADYVALLPNETVELEVIDDHLLVKCGGHKTKIRGVGASDFPLIPPVTANTTYNISASSFRGSLAQVVFAVANNESRPELSGIYMNFNLTEGGEGKLVMAATDSYRLAEKIIKINEGSSKEQKDIIIPSRTLQEIIRILSVFKDSVESPEAITVMIGDNQVVFKYGTVELTSRTIEGQYPDYRQIIPQTFPSKAAVINEDLIKATKTASLFSKTGLFDVSVQLKPAESVLAISSTSVERGENTTNTSAEIEGQDNSITVNYRYLIDGLSAMEGEKSNIQIIDASNPCMITPSQQFEGESYIYIIMPIKP